MGRAFGWAVGRSGRHSGSRAFGWADGQSIGRLGGRAGNPSSSSSSSSSASSSPSSPLLPFRLLLLRFLLLCLLLRLLLLLRLPLLPLLPLLVEHAPRAAAGPGRAGALPRERAPSVCITVVDLEYTAMTPLTVRQLAEHKTPPIRTCL